MYKKLIAFLIALGLVFPNLASSPYKCCTPDQWEGRISMDVNQVAFFVHMNISADVAYDYTNNMTFLNITGILKSPLYGPDPQIVSVLYIEDYKNEIEYEVDNGTSCQKSYMSGFVITKQCIKSSDKLLYSGLVGNGIMTDTYNTSLSGQYDNVQATIQRGTCLPVHLAYIGSDMFSISSIDVFNITPGIKDRTIFEKPPQCTHMTSEHSKKEEQLLNYILRSLKPILFRRQLEVV